jgi:hypothetical protein
VRREAEGESRWRVTVVNFYEHNDEVDALRRRWAAWRSRPFPRGWAGVDINGFELVLIDADIAELVMSAVERGPLSAQTTGRLAELAEELREALDSIGEDATEYFSELVSMADAAVLLSASSRSPKDG